MNRADLAKQVLLYDSLAAAAKDRAAGFRHQLTVQAKAELENEGTAPTWRLPGVGAVTLPVSQETVYLADEKARQAWVETEEPSAIETVTTTQVAPAYVVELEKRLIVADGMVIDPASGQQVPGYAVRAGGLPMPLSIRPTADAKSVMREHANGLLAQFEASLTGGESA